jgi:hypothetical protein
VIEWVRTSQGEQVVRFKGRLLSSRFQPAKEAADWVAGRLTFVENVKTVFLLGAGSVYHAIALQERAPQARIIVLDQHLELIEAGRKARPQLQICYEHVSSLSQLRQLESVRKGVRSSFLVLTHPASTSLAPAFYMDLSRQLMGRDWGSLTWQWQLRDMPDLTETLRVESSAVPLSIYDLEQTELVQNSEERERQLIKALRELVK